MEKLIIEIDLENDAFQPDPWPEVVALLSKITKRAEFCGFENRAIIDSNGTKVGKVVIR